MHNLLLALYLDTFNIFKQVLFIFSSLPKEYFSMIYFTQGYVLGSFYYAGCIVNDVG